MVKVGVDLEIKRSYAEPDPFSCYIELLISLLPIFLRQRPHSADQSLMVNQCFSGAILQFPELSLGDFPFVSYLLLLISQTLLPGSFSNQGKFKEAKASASFWD